jgi:regulator of ribonuclease activity A
MSADSISTPDLADAHAGARALDVQWRDFGGRRAFAGAVVTIKCHEDNSLVKACVAEPGEGRVIVVDGGGSLRRALLGDQLAATAVASGWAGLVIYGAVRDVDDLETMDLGIKALGTCPLKTDRRGEGQHDVTVSIGGVTISPGDWLYADRNGVLVSPAALS